MIENNTEHSLTIGFIKKFDQTKFCAVRQNLEFCQTHVWQNLKVFRKHWEKTLFLTLLKRASRFVSRVYCWSLMSWCKYSLEGGLASQKYKKEVFYVLFYHDCWFILVLGSLDTFTEILALHLVFDASHIGVNFQRLICRCVLRLFWN